MLDAAFFSYTVSRAILIGKGIGLTLQLAFGGLVMGLLVGLFLTILRQHRWCAWLVQGVVSFVRGTPLILQLSFVYFALPQLLSHHFPHVFSANMDIKIAGIVVFGLNSSAYITEILQAGVISLPQGQREACQALGISPFYMWKDILLPQAFCLVLPPLLNETIALLKETPLISIIGGADIMRQAQYVAAQDFTYFLPLVIAVGYYYVLVLLVEAVGHMLQKRWCRAASS